MITESERLRKRLTNKALLDKIKQGDSLYSQSKFDEAIVIFKELAQEIEKSYEYDICECYRKLGNCYYNKTDQDNARYYYEKTLKYCTTNSSIYSLLAYLYYYADNDKAINYYSKTIALQPKDEVATAGKCLAMLKSDKYSQKSLKEAFEKQMNETRKVILNGKEPFDHTSRKQKKKKKLKIGYLSSDFYTHAMMRFILPLFEAHNKTKFDIVLYSCSKKQDITTDKIKSIGFEFKDCAGKTNFEVAQMIYDDNVDILVDISGFTHCKCFALFFKPAPIQVQYLGFVNTMGMKEIDYIIADEFTIPKRLAKYYTEKPMYLDTCMNRFAFDESNPSIPAVNELPYYKNGYITFGSYNCTSKINNSTIKLWSNLLKQVLRSKLLIYRTQMTDNIIEAFKERFKEHGIDESRLIFMNKSDKPSHFYAYHMSDIALDTIPFNGLTITLELIGMGVPVLTLIKDSMQSRGCARVNRALGYEDLIAKTEKEYIEKAKKLANDVEALDNFRKTARSNLVNSILVRDKLGFVLELEKAYLKAWDDFCKK